MGLKNGSATCYMNAVFQQLFMLPGLRQSLLAEPEESEATRGTSLFYQMQTTFANLALGRQQAFRPSGIWATFKDYDGEPINVREHQDAQEFLTRMQVGPLHVAVFCPVHLPSPYSLTFGTLCPARLVPWWPTSHAQDLPIWPAIACTDAGLYFAPALPATGCIGRRPASAPSGAGRICR